LYQEICPLHPLVASSLAPDEFCRFITDPSKAISVPRVFFVELDLAEMADDPERGRAADLPYAQPDHVRDCLVAVERDPGKRTKTVDRIHPQEFPYRCVKGGFYLGDQDYMRYYPFPSEEDLQANYESWWRDANR
jgi:hypothetical protein